MKKKIIWAMALVSLLPFTNNLQAQKTAENQKLEQSKTGSSNYNSNIQNQKVMETKKTFVDTKIGQIAVYSKTSDSDKTPVIFLHGVYFDHNLWNTQATEINDRTVIMIDMPLHGESKQNVPEKWTLEDCADMLIDILNKLQIPKVIAIGHSWGSMTILRAANKHPENFASVGFCNMPFEKATPKMIKTFRTQHSFLIFRNFYMKQTGNFLIGKEAIKKDPTLLSSLLTPMKKLSNKEIKLIDKYVILDADDADQMIKNLKVPSLALKGKDDYVPAPLTIQTIIVPGGAHQPFSKSKRGSGILQKSDRSYSMKKSNLQLIFGDLHLQGLKQVDTSPKLLTPIIRIKKYLIETRKQKKSLIAIHSIQNRMIYREAKIEDIKQLQIISHTNVGLVFYEDQRQSLVEYRIWYKGGTIL